MESDSPKHRRKSTRLKGYDYSQAGAYFVTLCSHNKVCLFGEVSDGKMRLNDAGVMVGRWWAELNNKFPQIETDESIVMPNHFHGIVFIVGAAGCGCPQYRTGHPHRGAPTGLATTSNTGHPLRGAPTEQTTASQTTASKASHPQGDDPTLGVIMDWFKTMTTNAYIHGVRQKGWRPFSHHFWQRNYYDHVIRNEEDLNQKRDYILNNPLKWELDSENPQNIQIQRS